MPRRNRNATKGLAERKRRHSSSKQKGRSINAAPLSNFDGHFHRRLR